MPYQFYNPNPSGRKVDDCVVRAISKLFDICWDDAYFNVAMQGAVMRNMPSANEVWGEYLRANGFSRYTLPDFCPNCYTISMFASDHPVGRYALATGSHVVALVDGVYYDASDSGDEVVAYYWKR